MNFDPLPNYQPSPTCYHSCWLGHNSLICFPLPRRFRLLFYLLDTLIRSDSRALINAGDWNYCKDTQGTVSFRRRRHCWPARNSSLIEETDLSSARLGEERECWVGGWGEGNELTLTSHAKQYGGLIKVGWNRWAPSCARWMGRWDSSSRSISSGLTRREWPPLLRVVGLPVSGDVRQRKLLVRAIDC